MTTQILIPQSFKSAQPQELVERSFDSFHLLESLGVGPDGSSFLGIDAQTGDEVLVFLPGDDLPINRLAEIQSQLRILSSFPQQRVARVVATDMVSERKFWVTQWSPDPTLWELSTQHETRSEYESLRVAIDVAQIVVDMQRLGLQHPALSPHAVQKNAQGEVHINYACFQTGPATEELPAEFSQQQLALRNDPVERETVALCHFIEWLIDTADSGNEAASIFTGRHAAALTHLLHSVDESTVDALPGCRAIHQALMNVLKNISDSHAANGDALKNDVDQTNEIVVNANVDGTNVLAIAAEDLPIDSTAIAPPTQVAMLQPGDQLGRYELLKKLGEGGMGSVFKARDVADDTLVAVKTISSAASLNPNALRRFHKEARLLASINNPYITNLREINEDQGVHFLVIDLVEGVTLEAWLKQRERFTETEALTLVADITRGLLEAHDRGIVHRDIKPENVLIGRTIEELENDLPNVGVGAFRDCVRLSDFGIARQVNQSESLAVTQANALVGTPLYMSPEQCKGTGDVSPQSDIYALGITLFELLTGQTPFYANDAMKLAAMHCFDAPPSLTKFNCDVSDRTAALVAKALHKKPAERFADAVHFLGEIESILRRETVALEAHPRLPEHNAQSVVSETYEWLLTSSPQQLWPYISDTDRLNQAMGLPAPQFETIPHVTEGLQTTAKVNMGPFEMRWREHAFEWIEGQRMSVLREFENGPFEWFSSTVQATPTIEGKTRLTHELKFQPRGIMGSMLANFETRWKSRRALHRIYERIDRSLQGKLESQLADAFADQSRMSNKCRARLEQRLEELNKSGVDLAITQAFGDFLIASAPQTLSRIKPYELAEILSLTDDQAIKLCLRAAKAGILTIAWQILCPVCQTAAGIESTLKELEKHAACDACQLDFDLDFSSSVELAFAVHPEIKRAEQKTFCIGGPARKPHIAAQIRLEPYERLELELTLEPGDFVVKSRQLAFNQRLRVTTNAAPNRAELRFGDNAERKFTPVLRQGKQLLTLANESENALLLRLERTINSKNVVTAAQAASLALFRELFPEQSLQTGQLVTTQQVTLLVTTLADVDTVYETHNDAEAFRVLSEWGERITAVVDNHNGAVIKQVGETVTASFDDSEHAVRAALAFAAALQESSTTSDLKIKTGVHRGETLATTVNRQLDYFGATMRLAEKLPKFIAASELALSEPVFRDPAVVELGFENAVCEIRSTKAAGKELLVQVIRPE